MRSAKRHGTGVVKDLLGGPLPGAAARAIRRGEEFHTAQVQARGATRRGVRDDPSGLRDGARALLGHRLQGGDDAGASEQHDERQHTHNRFPHAPLPHFVIQILPIEICWLASFLHFYFVTCELQLFGLATSEEAMLGEAVFVQHLLFVLLVLEGDESGAHASIRIGLLGLVPQALIDRRHFAFELCDGLRVLAGLLRPSANACVLVEDPCVLDLLQKDTFVFEVHDRAVVIAHEGHVFDCIFVFNLDLAGL
mmetsp:Transcript_28672/g.95172  ORF Transcript_28672/g.95172 Transcript_28672/m.95172 type:complete len:252 (-) Transcript_28672:1027-1782(-)